MKPFFLPFVRRGLQAASAGSGRPRIQARLRLAADGHEPLDLDRELALLGPGDVLGLDPRQILRLAPAPGAQDADVELFPCVELDDPDLPWAFTPAPPDGARHAPWIALVVVAAQPGVAVTRGGANQSPQVLELARDVAERELPPLAEAWAWAHVQVVAEHPDQIADTLERHPDRTLARLLCPRRLEPRRTYHACVVPTFRAGVRVGLGDVPGDDPAPAWGDGEWPARLPAYVAWTFTTGEAGDFESLARALHGEVFDPPPAAAPLRAVFDPGAAAVAVTVDLESPFVAGGQRFERDPRPPGAVAAIAEAVAGGTAERPVLGPSYFGGSWVAPGASPPGGWAAELNDTPALRAAAGLGVEVVRREQEALVAAARTALETQRTLARAAARQRTGIALTNRVGARLAAAPAAEVGPVLARAAGVAEAGALSPVARRISRKVAPRAAVARRAAEIGDLPELALADAGDVEIRYPLPLYEAHPFPAAAELVDPTTVGEGEFALRIDRPLLEPLAAAFPSLVLPLVGGVPADAAVLVEAGPRFVEAFLVGANEELHRELLWRGLSAEVGGTPFRRFFPRAAGAVDIDDLRSWDPGSPLGSHLHDPPSLVLVVRSELVRRYPSLLVAAAEAEWVDSARQPRLAATPVLPAFRGRIGEDVLYAGFTTLTEVEAVGSSAPPGPSGWYFLLAENPGDARFGLDPHSADPPSRDTLAWNHLGADALHARVDAFPSLPEFAPATATSARLAFLLRQRPFRAYLHGSVLIRTGS